MDKMMNSEIFLQKYRVLEGLLEKRYEGKKLAGSSVVMEYIREEDSEPVRVDLDLLREIRNILSHNADSDGTAVVEPSDEMLAKLDEITAYVKRCRVAGAFGTPAEQIFSAHPNDNVFSVMRTMFKNGYSHVPVREHGVVTGVLSRSSIFEYLAEHGMNSLDDSSRISALGDSISIGRQNGKNYIFVPADTSIVSVRRAFQSVVEKNIRLRAVFVTQNGLPTEKLICMLTPWDVLSNQPLDEGDRHDTRKHKD